MANVKITALEHLSSTQLAPEDVFVIDDVSSLITRKITTSNVTRYLSVALGNAHVVGSNLSSFASYANANAAALALSISNISANFSIAGDTGTDVVVVGPETLTFRGSQGINTSVGANEVKFTLANSGVISGIYGGATSIPSIIVDAQGRVTSASNVSIDLASIQTNVSSVATEVANLELRRASNTFYSYNVHSVVSTANVLPETNNTQSLGSVDFKWKDIYVGPGSVYIGSLKLSDTGTNSLKITDGIGNSLVVDSNLAQVSNTVGRLSSDIGDLAQLTTTEKSNLVSAINEIQGVSSFTTMQLGSYTFSEQVTNNVNSTGATVFSMPKADKHFAKLLINVEDLTYGQYQSSELLLVQDGNDTRLVEYGIVFTSTNPIASFETLFDGSNVIVRANALSSDNRIRVLKIII